MFCLSAKVPLEKLSDQEAAKVQLSGRFRQNAGVVVWDSHGDIGDSHGDIGDSHGYTIYWHVYIYIIYH